MLKIIRTHAKYFYVPMIIGVALLVLSFLFWGAPTNRGDEKGYETVAQIGSKKISLSEFTTTYYRAADNLRQMYGSKFDEDMAKALKKTVLNQMVSDEVLAQAAKKEGIVVTDQELSDFITSAPAFNVGGVFSRSRYEQFLRYSGETEDDLRRALLVQKMRQLVAGSIDVSPTELQGLPKMDEKTAGILKSAILKSKQERALQSYIAGLEIGMHIVEKPELL